MAAYFLLTEFDLFITYFTCLTYETKNNTARKIEMQTEK